MGDLTPMSNRQLRRSEVTLLAAMYFPLEEVDNAVEVSWLESKWWTGARNTDGEDSRGLWQLNVADGADPGLATYNLFDPQVNAYFAARLQKSRGWQPWYNAAKQLGLL